MSPRESLQNQGRPWLPDDLIDAHDVRMGKLLEESAFPDQATHNPLNSQSVCDRRLRDTAAAPLPAEYIIHIEILAPVQVRDNLVAGNDDLSHLEWGRPRAGLCFRISTIQHGVVTCSSVSWRRYSLA